MSPTNAAAVHRGWKTETVRQTIRQGPIFVVLVLILYGLWDGTPKVLRAVQDGYETLQTRHDANLDRVIKSHEEDRGLLREDQAMLRKSIELLADRPRRTAGDVSLHSKGP